jgi:hypothetical protein
VVHRLNAAELRVLSSFLAGRLPAGQVHEQLERARAAQAPAPSIEPPVAPAVAPVRAVAA